MKRAMAPPTPVCLGRGALARSHPDGRGPAFAEEATPPVAVIRMPSEPTRMWISLNLVAPAHRARLLALAEFLVRIKERDDPPLDRNYPPRGSV